MKNTKYENTNLIWGDGKNRNETYDVNGQQMADVEKGCAVEMSEG